MQNGQRILTFDLLRGYFLFVIIIDHLSRFPGIFEYLTGKGWLWTSAAEGFFFISGIMLGLIRARKEKDLSYKIVTKKVISRALLLYILTVSLTILFSIVAAAYVGNGNLKAGSNPIDPIMPFLQNALTFQYIYGWQDFLKYYTIFLLVSPLAIFLLRKNLWFILLSVTIAVWYFFRKDYFSSSWQILFFTGMIVGYFIPEIQNFYSNLSERIRKIFTSIILSLSAITLVTSVLVVHYSMYIKDTGYWKLLETLNLTTNDLFDKASLPLPRLLIFYLWFTALFILFNRFEKIIIKFFGKFLFTLGKNSLLTYVTHSFFVFFIYLYIPNDGDFLSNIIITSLTLFLIYEIIKNKCFIFNIFQNIKRFSFRNLERVNYYYIYNNFSRIQEVQMQNKKLLS